MLRVTRPSAFRKFIFLIFAAVCAYLVFTLFSQQSYMRVQEAERALLKTRLDEALTVNESLSRQLEAAGGLDTAQHIVREKLGWVRPGELIFIQSTDAIVLGDD